MKKQTYIKPELKALNATANVGFMAFSSRRGPLPFTSVEDDEYEMTGGLITDSHNYGLGVYDRNEGTMSGNDMFGKGFSFGSVWDDDGDHL